MTETQFSEKAKLLSPPYIEENEILHAVGGAERSVKEAETLVLAVTSSMGELNQALTVVLGLSDLLLDKVDQSDPIVADLLTIFKQVNRMRQTLKDIDDLTQQELVD